MEISLRRVSSLTQNEQQKTDNYLKINNISLSLQSQCYWPPKSMQLASKVNVIGLQSQCYWNGRAKNLVSRRKNTSRFTLYGNLSRTDATMMLFIVDHAELPRCHAVDGLCGMNDITAFSRLLYGCRMIFGRMSNLEGNVLHIQRLGEEMEIVYLKVRLVGRLRVVSPTDIEHVGLNVLLHHKPRTASKAQSVTLTNGVKP